MKSEGIVPTQLNFSAGLREQVKQWAAQNIETGKWAPRQPIPTDMQLADQLGVHYQTVRSALAELAKQGYLVRCRGRGTFVAEQRVKHHFGILFGSDAQYFHASAYLSLFAKYAEEFFGERQCRAKPYLVQRWVRKGQAVCNEDFARDLEDRSLRGCLVVNAAFSAADSFDLLLRRGVPFVMAEYCPTNFPSFSFDLGNLVAEGLRYLAARGYRRIAIVYGHFANGPVTRTEEVFYRAYQSVTRDLGLEWRREWVKDEREPGQEAGYQAMKELAALGVNRPEAVLSCDDVITQGIIHAWWELGWRVPRDLGFVTHANKDTPLLYPIPFTRLECDVKELVTAAAGMLVALTEGQPLAERAVRIKPRLVVGESCGEKPQQPTTEGRMSE